MGSSCHLQPLPRTPTSSSAPRCKSRSFCRTSHTWHRQGVVSGSLWLFCEKCSQHHLTLLHESEHFSQSFDVEMAKINTPLLGKAIYMHHRSSRIYNVITVPVLEATQTAEPILPILPVCPCVARHSESHL